MRVLVVAESFFYDLPNGLARVAWDVCRGLVSRGHDVDLVCPSGEVRGDMTTSELEGVQVTRYPRPRVSGLDPTNPWKHVAGYRAAIERLATRRVWDVAHSHGIYAIAGSASSVPRIPRILTIHSPAFLEQAWNWTHGRFADWLKIPGLLQIGYFEAEAMKAAAICHTLSHFTRESMERLYPAASGRTWRVIPHWADDTWKRHMPSEEARRILGWPLEPPVILAVRQLKPRYGLDVALRGLAPAIRSGRFIFRICGDGAEGPRLRRLANSLGIAEGVVFEGHVPDAHLRLCYQAADVCVIPSVALECFGLIVLEAYAAGVPVVSTSNGALPELVARVSPSLLVPPRDSHRFGETVSRLIDGQTPRPSAQSLVDYVARSFAADRSLAQYEQMYRKAIDDNG